MIICERKGLTLLRLWLFTIILTLFIGTGIAYSEPAGDTEVMVSKLRQQETFVTAYKAMSSELKSNAPANSANNLGIVTVKYIYNNDVLKEIKKEVKISETINIKYENIESYAFKETVIDGKKAGFNKNIVFTPTNDKKNMEIKFYCEKIKYDYTANIYIKDDKGRWIDISEKYLKSNPMDYGFAAGKYKNLSKEFIAPGEYKSASKEIGVAKKKDKDGLIIEDKSGIEYVYTGKCTIVRHESDGEKTREYKGKKYTTVFNDKCDYIEIIYYYKKR